MAIDLILLLRTSSSLKKFIDKDLHSTLIDSGIQSAHIAMISSETARDKKSHLWSALNHLESSEAVLKDYNPSDPINVGFSYVKSKSLLNKLLKILALKSVLYFYLQEFENSDETISDMKSIKQSFINMSFDEQNSAIESAANENPFTLLISLPIQAIRYGINTVNPTNWNHTREISSSLFNIDAFCNEFDKIKERSSNLEKYFSSFD